MIHMKMAALRRNQTLRLLLQEGRWAEEGILPGNGSKYTISIRKCMKKVVAEEAQ